MSLLGSRAAGVLCPISALPGPHGIGDLGSAIRFLDFLERGAQGVWQVLPVHPTTSIAGNSPYTSLSAFALDPLLLAADPLVAAGWLDVDDVGASMTGGPVDFDAARARRRAWLDTAWRRLADGAVPDEECAMFEAFGDEQPAWVGELADFVVLRRMHGGASWVEWEEPLRTRDPDALARMRETRADELAREALGQYLLLRQWQELRDAAADRGIRLFGDLPMYVAHDSADVWCRPELFQLAADGRPDAESGVPPDLFSETGQLWRQPLYDWERAAEDGYAWFARRIAHEHTLFDLVRIDHFRAISAYFAVPAGAETAAGGAWHDGPGAALLEAIADAVDAAALVAEDLGDIDPPVHALMDAFGLPGMRVLQFGFQDGFPDSRHLPHRYVEDCVAYTGTHDNDTARGWFEGELSDVERARVLDYAGADPGADVADAMARMVWRSVARLAVVPLQDVLGLGGEARGNRPGIPDGNWRWRVASGALTDEAADRLAARARTYDRAPRAPGSTAT